VEAVCAENREALAGSVARLGDLSERVAAARTPAELTALSVEADERMAQALAKMRALQTQLTEAAVPADQVEDRDLLVEAMGKIVFALATFATRAVAVLATGDSAAVDAYVSEAEASLAALAILEQEMAVPARALDAPSCSVQGTSSTPPTGPPAPTPEAVPAL
jgi:hypothetical protein